MHLTLRLLLVLGLLTAAPVASSWAADPAPKTEDDNVLYAIGLGIARSLAGFNLTEKQIKFVLSGISDGALGNDPKVDLQEYQPKIQAFVKERAKATADKEKEASREFLEKAASQAAALAAAAVTSDGAPASERSGEEG